MVSFSTSDNFIDSPSELAVDTIALLCILFIAFTFRLADGNSVDNPGEGFSRLPCRYTCDGQARS